MDCGEGGIERSCHLQIVNDDGIEFSLCVTNSSKLAMLHKFQFMYKFQSFFNYYITTCCFLYKYIKC